MKTAQGKRQLQKAATREHIIETAMSIYPVRGFSVPTNIIAREAGVAHGTLFIHFPTREDLLLHALERFAANIGEKLHELSFADSDIETLLRAHMDIIEENEAFYKNLIGGMPNLPPEARIKFISLNSIASHHFSAAMRRGVESGEIKELPVHMAYNTWIGLIHYYLQNSELFAPGGESVLARYKDELINGYVSLIKK